jgi:hypothetical protein
LKKVPEKIIKNIAYQIPPQTPVVKRLSEYTVDEIKQVPRLFEWLAFLLFYFKLFDKILSILNYYFLLFTI